MTDTSKLVEIDQFKEKLIKMIQTAKSKKQYDFLFGNIDDAIDMKSDEEYIADHLIANGVTVQEWIPVKDRLPEKNTSVLAYRESGRCVLFYDRYGFCEIDECRPHPGYE